MNSHTEGNDLPTERPDTNSRSSKAQSQPSPPITTAMLHTNIVDLLIGEVEYDSHFAPTELENTNHHILICNELADEIMSTIDTYVESRVAEAQAEQGKAVGLE